MAEDVDAGGADAGGDHFEIGSADFHANAKAEGQQLAHVFGERALKGHGDYCVQVESYQRRM